MSFGGILTSGTGATPNAPSVQGTQATDPRSRGLGAATYTAGGGVGQQQNGAPYASGAGGGMGGSTHSLVVLLVVMELAALVALRAGFRNYHGG